MINNVVLVSGIQPGDAVIHMRVSVLFQVLFPLKLLQNMELSSLCYTVGPCWFLFYLFGGGLVVESDSCNLMDCSPLGSSVHGISQARILEWVSFSRGSSCPRDRTHVSCISFIGRWVLHHCTTWEPT